jgi:CBS domain-containing protein
MDKEIISIATTNPITLKPDDILGDAIKIMAKHGFRRLPIVHDMYLVGILTATDVLKALNEGNPKILETPIDSFMTPEPFFVYRDVGLSSAIDLMFQHDLGSLPIIAEGSETLAGIVTERDLVKHFSEVADADLSEFITNNPITLPFDTSDISTIIESMVNSTIRRAILVDGGNNVKGIVTSTDVLRFVSDQIIKFGTLKKEIFKEKAYEIAKTNVSTVSYNSSMADVAAMLAEKGMGGVPVTNEQNELVGIFTERDLLRVIALYRLM